MSKLFNVLENYKLAFVNKYYDKDADWEFRPNVVSLESYFQNYAQ